MRISEKSINENDWFNDDNALAYDLFTQSYNFYWALAKSLFHGIDFSQSNSVLDIACGTGVAIRVLRENCNYNKTLTGIDLSQAMLSIASNRCKQLNVNFKNIGAESIGSEFKDIDVVTCNAALWQLPIADVFDGILSCLTPGGSFAFNLPNVPNFTTVSSRFVLKELECKGFKVIYMSDFCYLPFSEEVREFKKIPVFSEGGGLNRYGANWTNYVAIL